MGNRSGTRPDQPGCAPNYLAEDKAACRIGSDRPVRRKPVTATICSDYSDGRPRCSQVVAVDDPTVGKRYFIEWDTRVEARLSDSLPFLQVQTADGRGLWLDLDLYNIPQSIMKLRIPVNADLDRNRSLVPFADHTKDGAALLGAVVPPPSTLLPFRYFIPGAFGNDKLFPAGRPPCAKVADQRTLTNGVSPWPSIPRTPIAS